MFQTTNQIWTIESTRVWIENRLLPSPATGRACAHVGTPKSPEEPILEENEKWELYEGFLKWGYLQIIIWIGFSNRNTYKLKQSKTI